MRDAATKLTKTEGDKTTQWGVLFGSGFPDWLSWIWSNGSDFFNADHQHVVRYEHDRRRSDCTIHRTRNGLARQRPDWSVCARRVTLR